VIPTAVAAGISVLIGLELFLYASPGGQ